MKIEEEIFKRSHINIKKALSYGFIKEKSNYYYEELFLKESFKAIIQINNNKITGKVIDLDTNEEYTNIRTEQNGEFVSKVREEYKNILLKIKKDCCDTDYFLTEQANRITQRINNKYNTEPEFLWDNTPEIGVFRNKANQKWFGIIMNIDQSKIRDNHGLMEIMNVKLPENEIPELLKKEGYYKAYHMNKKNWITISLDNTLSDEEILKRIEESYQAIKEGDCWLIPANPKYYDIIHCFDHQKEIIWKQSSNIQVGDTIYLYVAEPYGKVYYKCIATEVDIPYDYQDQNLRIQKVMKIELIKRLDNKNYNFAYLKEQGITAIRGPRKIEEKIVFKKEL